MSEETNGARRLFEAFTHFHRLRWKPESIQGIRFSEIPVLKCIRKSGAGYLTISEISCILDLTSPTVTQMVNNLENKGLVERKVAEHDRRVVEVSLTSKGLKVLEDADQKILCNLHAVADYLGEEDTQTLARIIEKIYTFYNEPKQ